MGKRDICDYLGVQSDSITELNEEVKRHLKKGYQPFGPIQIGLGVRPDGIAVIRYVQTLVKYE